MANCMIKKCVKKIKGFFIIETVIALFILGVGVAAVTQLFASTATQSGKNERYLTAMGLAQEGVELVRYLRNNNIVQEKTDPFEGIAASSDKCIFAIPLNDISLKDCVNLDDTRLGVPDISGPHVHVYQENPSTPDSSYPFFWRKIYIENLNSGKARRITSVVFFRQPTNFPPTAANIPAQCTLAKSCVFVSAILQ